MKKIIFLSFILFLSISIHGQEKESKSIAESLKVGDVAKISEYFPSSLDMTISQTEDVFSKAQATQILSQFFKTHKPSDFIVKHKGSSKGGDFYEIGTLKTMNGEFRVTFFLKKDGDKIFIKRLKIEDNEGNF